MTTAKPKVPDMGDYVPKVVVSTRVTSPRVIAGASQGCEGYSIAARDAGMETCTTGAVDPVDRRFSWRGAGSLFTRSRTAAKVLAKAFLTIITILVTAST